MTLWVERLKRWVLEQTPHHPVMVMRYEDLQKDTVGEVRRMLDFLQVASENLPQRLSEGFTTFKRSHGGVEFERYTSKQRLSMKSWLQRAVHLANERNMSHVLKLNDYLENF